ncbi:hypothetical protein [Neorhizobium tomejilense]|uniref:hypothetical protein n=1 Tax=Neorhizobium tomejilense TaxID=2093828 RepID=UPI003ECF3FA8
MTCIVALQHNGKVYVGGDAAGTSSWSLSQMISSHPKVFEKSELIIGYSGSFRDGQIVRYATEFPRCHPAMDGHEYLVTNVAEVIRHSLKAHGAIHTKDGVDTMEGNFLVAFRDRLYTIHSDLCVLESSRPYVAIGSGEDLALGSLHTSSPDLEPTQRVLLALEAAATHNAGVRPPFTIKTFGDVEKEAA